MTNESKENLLKLITNAPLENPGSTHGEFTVIKSIENYTTSVSKSISHNGHIVFLYDNKIYICDKDYNVLFNDYIYINGNAWDVDDLDIDEDGSFYCTAHTWNGYEAGNEYLLYLNDITQKVEGSYQVVLRKSYLIEDVFDTITTEKGAITTNIGVLLKKSPIDSRFIFMRYGKVDSGGYNLIIVMYHVNFSGGNDYEYRVAKVGSKDYAYIENYIVSWTNENANVKLLIRNSANNISSVSETTAVDFYLSTCDFSEYSTINSTNILSVNNYLMSHYYMVNGAVFADYDTLYFSIGTKDTYASVLLYKYDTTLHLLKTYEGNAENQIIYIQCTITLVNRQIFAFYRYSINGGNFDGKFIHITNDLFEYNLASTLNIFTNMLIQNTYNLYSLFLNGIIASYTFKNSGYNGDEYLGNGSVTTENMQLYGPDGNILFDRNLYDKQLASNTVYSVTQVPFNLLNDKIISVENLKSKTNSIVDSNSEEIEKNIYEELVITNLDQFKVYDNNNGSAYNANSSIEVAKNVYNGFESGYKITKIRINYENSHKDMPITDIVRTGNEAIITMYVYHDGIKNIQLYDDNFSIPFVTIDMSYYEENKLYKLTEKVKVE